VHSQSLCIGFFSHPELLSKNVAISLEGELCQEEVAKVLGGFLRIDVGEVLAASSQEADVGKFFEWYPE